MEEYLLALKIDGISAVYHGRKTFVLGFITCMKSVELLVTELLFREENPTKYFLTYKLSQDHIELFFACIRARGGWNNNPNCQQFQSSMKALLLKNCLPPGSNSNVSESDCASDLPVCYLRSQKRKIISNDIDPLEDESFIYFQALESYFLSDYQNNILYYIAGFICRKVRKSLDCEECVSLLLRSNELAEKNVDHSYAKKPLDDYSGFTKRISRGGLLLASESVFKVVQFCEKSFRSAVKGSHVSINKVFINNIVSHLASLANIFQNHSATNAIDIEDLHSINLIKNIVFNYVSMRGKSHGKQVTLNDQRSYGVRQKLTKPITFSNV